MWNGGLFQLPAKGGQPKVLLRPDGKESYAFVFPRIVSGRPEVLYSSWGLAEGIWRLDLASGNRSEVVRNANSGTITTSGHLLAGLPDASSGFLSGLLAGPATGIATPSHALVQVLPGVNYATNQPDLWSSVSDTGTLAYVPADVSAQSLVFVSMKGQADVFSSVPGAYAGVSVSPVTRRVVASADRKVWLYAPDGASRERLAPENRDSHEGRARWTPDGKAVIYESNQSGNWDIFRRVPGESKSEVLLTKELDQNCVTIAPDGRIAYAESHPTTGHDIWLLEADGKTRPWLVSAKNELPVRFSPDGRWLAYRSDESGRFEIYVRSVNGEAARVQVSTSGALNAAWSPSGNKLYYLDAGAMWAVDLGHGDAPVPGLRGKLFEGGWALIPLGDWDFSDFDVMPDGERFLMIRREPKAIPDRIHVVVNWYDELRRLVPVK
jgi:hypothetical protein